MVVEVATIIVPPVCLVASPVINDVIGTAWKKTKKSTKHLRRKKKTANLENEQQASLVLEQSCPVDVESKPSCSNNRERTERTGREQKNLVVEQSCSDAEEEITEITEGKQKNLLDKRNELENLMEIWKLVCQAADLYNQSASVLRELTKLMLTITNCSEHGHVDETCSASHTEGITEISRETNSGEVCTACCAQRIKAKLGPDFVSPEPVSDKAAILTALTKQLGPNMERACKEEQRQHVPLVAVDAEPKPESLALESTDPETEVRTPDELTTREVESLSESPPKFSKHVPKPKLKAPAIESMTGETSVFQGVRTPQPTSRTTERSQSSTHLSKQKELELQKYTFVDPEGAQRSGECDPKMDMLKLRAMDQLSRINDYDHIYSHTIFAHSVSSFVAIKGC